MTSMPDEKIITVFGSSRPQEGEADYEEARILGREVAACGFAICSGGYAGVMQAVSQGAKEVGGKTYGVTAEFFAAAKVNPWIDVEVRVRTWQERLFELARLANGFVICKGGTGTLAELAVVWEMMNKSVAPPKPCVILGDFWTPILNRVREVELGHAAPWGESRAKLVDQRGTPREAASFLQALLG
jgi:uncharacterized protein (TIGR00730 family)